MKTSAHGNTTQCCRGWRKCEPGPFDFYRYIELNPIRAGMVAHPRDYRWTSYHANGDGRPDGLITPHAEYLRIDRDPARRREHYRALFRAHMEAETLEEIRDATNGNYVLGDTRFQTEIARMLKRRVVRGQAGRPPSATAQDRQADLF